MIPGERILITGAKGVIGGILTDNLSSSFKVTPVDLPEVDLRDPAQVNKVMKDQDVVIHLAWHKREIRNGIEVPVDDADTEDTDPMNVQMALNVYKAASELRVKRVIMASSVCVNDFLNWQGSGLLRTDTITTPFKPYGASKLCVEANGRYFADYHDLEVVCIRFGAIRGNNLPPVGQEHIFLSHEDCIGAVRVSIMADKIPNKFSVFYAISDNPGKIHDLTNPLGWAPKDPKLIK